MLDQIPAGGNGWRCPNCVMIADFRAPERVTRFARLGLCLSSARQSWLAGTLQSNDNNSHPLGTIGLPVKPQPPFAWIDSPDRQPWGAIPDCLAPFPRAGAIKAGRIVVPLGNIAEGYIHVVKRHGARISSISGMSVEEYLCDVCRHHQAIYQQQDASLWIFRHNGMTKCAVVSPVMIGDERVYKLITCYPIGRLPNFHRRGAVRLNPG